MVYHETQESFRFFTLADFSAIFKEDKEGILKDLKEYFGVELYACECRCERAGMGLCSLVKPRPNSHEGDN